ncbi:DUF2835 family protein [Balneatrix alpica]|uniref:DUF2835 family protein n=1 Tax=Balneatrix alpica TaxID=75684 RepID=A0ABV5Z9F9_9GAMM|nr:DUF2835 family protein [Balneatrix alpica]
MRLQRYRYRFYVGLSYDDFMLIYRGQARAVVVQTESGLSLRIPAERFRPFVSHSGIQGWFELEADEQHRFVAMRAL